MALPASLVVRATVRPVGTCVTCTSTPLIGVPSCEVTATRTTEEVAWAMTWPENAIAQAHSTSTSRRVAARLIVFIEFPLMDWIGLRNT